MAQAVLIHDVIARRGQNLQAIRATWKNGCIVPDVPVDWPEGCRLTIEPEPVETGSLGVREEDWSNSPAAVADWLAWYDSLEPLEFTADEQSDLTAWRRKVKENSQGAGFSAQA